MRGHDIQLLHSRLIKARSYIGYGPEPAQPLTLAVYALGEDIALPTRSRCLENGLPTWGRGKSEGYTLTEARKREGASRWMRRIELGHHEGVLSEVQVESEDYAHLFS